MPGNGMIKRVATLIINSDAPQMFRLPANPVCRYIKVYFGEEYKGTADQAMVSEFNVYGAE